VRILLDDQVASLYADLDLVFGGYEALLWVRRGV
jgi:hypothetical protein